MKPSLKSFLVFITSVVLSLNPVLSQHVFAQETIADFQFPKIELLESARAHITKDGNTTITVRATDNVGLESVDLLYRFSNQSEFVSKKMRITNQSDSVYSVSIVSGKNTELQYYFQAIDIAGNSVLKGQSLNPFTAYLKNNGSVNANKDSGKNRTLYYLLGAAAVVLLAGLAGGGKSGSTATSSTEGCSDDGCQVNLLVTNP